MKVNIKDIIFWLFLIVALALLLWNVFGNSPTELVTFISIIFMLVLKMWAISDQQIKSDIIVKNSFNKVKGEIDLIKKDVHLIREDIRIIRIKLK